MVNTLPTILYSLMLGMTALALFDLFKRPKLRQNQFLKGLLFLLVIHLLGELFIHSGAYVYAPGIAGLQFPFRALLGPAMFFYAHAAMSASQTVNKKLCALALSGPILVMLIMIPFVFMITSDEKLALADPITRDPELWRIAVLTCLSTTSVFICYTIGFLYLTFKLHQSHRQQLMERFSDIEGNSMDWLQPLLFVWGAIWLMFAVEFSMNALGWRWFGSGIVLPILEVVALIVFIQKALNQKELERSERGSPIDTSPRRAILESEKMQAIAEKLEKIMREEKAFLQDNLSLNKLSNSISESENHISETLSQFLKTNFFQFVNKYRIEAAKSALRETDKQVTSIAYDVGFSSKSTFNTAFKKFVGVSPTTYRKSVAGL